MTKWEKIYKEALEMLNNDDDLYVEMVNELDSWNGFADGFRCYPMDEIDDLFYGVTIGDFLDKLTADFNHRDNYLVDTIYGLESTDYPVEVYKDNTTTEEVLDTVIDCASHLYYSNGDFEKLIDILSNPTEETAQEITEAETV